MNTTGPGALLLSCIARLARADGRVADAELREIRDIVRELTGLDADLEVVRGVVRAEEDGEGAVEFVTRRAVGEPLEVRLLIARASYRVLASDGEITGTEAQTFNALLDGLDLPRTLVLRHLD